MTKISELIILGASSVLGKEFRELLNDHLLDIGSIRLMDEEDHSGELLSLRGEPALVTKFDPDVFSRGKIIVNAHSAQAHSDLLHRAILSGASWVDMSGTLNLNSGVPLVIPAINRDAITPETKIVACPSSPTVMILQAIYPIHQQWGICQLSGTILLGHSFHSQEAMDELFEQTRKLLSFQELPQKIWPFQVAFNAFPDMRGIDSSGFSNLERLIADEMERMLGVPNLISMFMAVWIPTFIGCGISLQLQFRAVPDLETTHSLLSSNLKIYLGDMEKGPEELAIFQTMRQEKICIGRLRTDRTDRSILSMWLAADNFRTGSVSNVIEICNLMNQQA